MSLLLPCENKPGLPDLEIKGWKIYGMETEYDWVEGNWIVTEQLIGILCADADDDDDDK